MSVEAPTDAAEAGLLIAAALESAGLAYAIGGALALGALGVPRGTLDVDVNVFVERDAYPTVLAALHGLGIAIDDEAALARAERDGPRASPRRPRPPALARAERDGMMVGSWAGMRVDVFVPSIPFSHEAGRTRVRLTDSAGRSADFLSAEALALFKRLFFRPKDVADLERLASVRGARLDRAYVRRWLVEMMGEDDVRVRTWDDVSRRFP